MRCDHEPPEVVSRHGWQFHHVGLPSRVQRAGEVYLPAYGMYVCGFPESPYGIEWMRFESDSPLPEPIRTIPHVAFEVNDLDVALAGKEILWPPDTPSAGVRSAMILDNGALIEVIWFRKNHPV